MALFFLVTGKGTYEERSSDPYAMWVVMSNSAMFVSCAFYSHLIIFADRLDDLSLVIDLGFLFCSSSFSALYHFCDTHMYTALDEDLDERVHFKFCKKNDEEFIFPPGDRYDTLQHYDFGFAFFLIPMSVLHMLDIKPAALKFALYWGFFQITWHYMSSDLRWTTGQLSTFKFVLAPIFLLLAAKTCYEARRVGGAREFARLVPLPELALTFVLMSIGIGCKVTTDEATRKSYSVRKFQKRKGAALSALLGRAPTTGCGDVRRRVSTTPLPRSSRPPHPPPPLRASAAHGFWHFGAFLGFGALRAFSRKHRGLVREKLDGARGSGEWKARGSGGGQAMQREASEDRVNGML